MAAKGFARHLPPNTEVPIEYLNLVPKADQTNRIEIAVFGQGRESTSSVDVKNPQEMLESERRKYKILGLVLGLTTICVGGGLFALATAK
jgi:hypothetical protein